MMNLPPLARYALSTLFTIAAAGGAQAGVFCVETSAELQFALAVAAVNGEDDEIRIATGTYPVPSGGFTYDTTPSAGDAHALTLSGGWSKVFGICITNTLDPAATRLDGGGNARVMTVGLRALSDFSVHRLTFANGNASASEQGDGGGLRIVPANGYVGSITVARNQFMNNWGEVGGGLVIRFFGSGAGTGAGARYRVLNNLFVLNEANGICGAAYVLTRIPDPVPIDAFPVLYWHDAVAGDTPPVNAEVVIANNTAAANSSGNMKNPIGGICLLSNVVTRMVINNNLWGNQGVDLAISPGGHALYNNNFGILSSAEPPVSAGDNLSLHPQYGPCVGGHCWIPTPESPLIDTGRDTVPGVEGWLSEHDLRGLPRVFGTAVDIGAYEGDWRIFTDRFEQP